MKKILFLLIAILFVNISCSSNDEVEEQVNIDYSQAPDDLKGNWKVDFYSYPDNPSNLSNNNSGFYIAISDNGKLSYKDIHTTSTNNTGTYTVFNNGFSVSILSGQVYITTKPSTIKPSYTEFKIQYTDVSLSTKNTILFAKKQ